MSQATTFGRRGVVATPAPPARYSAPPPAAQRSDPAPQALSPTPAPSLAPRPKEDSGSKGDSVGGYFLWLLFGFSGRLSRTNYRYCRIAANLAFLFVIYLLGSALRRNEGNLQVQASLALLGLGLFGLMAWTTLAMQVKRRHDRDKAWPWLFVGFIPVIGPLWVLIETCWLDGTPGYNRFDDASDTAASFG